MSEGHSWTRVTTDQPAVTGGLIVYGIILLASAGGGDVTLYEGLDTSSGRLICSFEGPNNETIPIPFFGGIRLERGLYVDIGTSLDSALIIWDPLPKS